MCEKAKEIQKSHTVVFAWDDYITKNNDEIVWLPKQEELQKIIFKGNDFYDNLLKFVNFLNDEYDHFSILAEKGTEDKYKDFSELWLAFVMKQKYNKIWNGKAWMTLKRISVK